MTKTAPSCAARSRSSTCSISALDAHIRHLAVTAARDAAAPVHQDPADAAPRMAETHTGARVLPAAHASR